MTTQEEIREWLEAELDIHTAFKYSKQETAQDILFHLHDNDVVIKVKCPVCAWSQFKDEAVGMTPCYSCNSTGYTVEPLIKETK